MAENKQYIANHQDNGTVFISEDVIGSVVLQALQDIDGFAGISITPGKEIVELISRKQWGKGIKVVIGDDNSLNVECNIIINFGHNVMDVANAVQKAATEALAGSVGIHNASIDVNVCGIVRN
jgi:uncharacterized alkaline shock family protein YloU